MGKIVFMGSCMIDLICYSSRLPKCGETIHGTSFQRDFGGKGANQCIAATRLGADTSLVACLGDDVFGKEYLNHLQQNGVDISHVSFVEKQSSGVAQISVADSGDNHIIIVAGANNYLGVEKVTDASKLLLEASIIVFQFETPWKTSLYALKYCKEHNTSGITVVNAAPADALVDKELYKYTDILCVNESEAEVITGQPCSSRAETEAAVRHLLALGPSTVIITLGKDGVVFGSKHDPAVQYEAGFPVKSPVDTTGAGDAFLGGLTFLLANRREWPLAKKIQVACKVASVSIMKRGTQASFPCAADVSVLSD